MTDNRFDQKEKIRERLREKRKRTAKEKRVLSKGSAEPRRGRPPGARNKRGIEVFGVDEGRLFKEIRRRAKGNPLHQMADELHLGVVLTNLRVIEEIKQVLDSGTVMLADVSESKSLLSALKGATAEVTSGLKALGLSATNRKVEQDDDDFLKRLSELDLDDMLPKALQGEYLAATEDLARTEGKRSGDGRKEKVLSSLLAKLKKPIRAYNEDNEEQPDDEIEKAVHDPRKDGLVIS